jgi:hypothetical protein
VSPLLPAPRGPAPVVYAVLALVAILWAHLLTSCAPRAPALMVPSPGATLPRYCAQAIRGNAELVVLCSDTWQTCEEARRAADRWGWWRGVHAVTPQCFRSDRKVREATFHEQKTEVR